MTNQAGETPTSSPGRFSLALEGKARGDEVGETGDQRPVSRKSRKLEGPEICRGGGGTWVNFCWVRAEGLSEPLTIIVYSVAKNRPHLSHFRANVILE